MSNRNIDVSVIVPCHNVEAFIEECLGSILAQSFCKEKTEIILVNDASSDRTLSVLKEYEKRYPDRIILVNCEENQGPGATRNIGIQYASGKYLMFVDADDTIHPESIECLYHHAVRHDCDVVRAGYRIFGDKDITVSEVRMPESLYTTRNDRDEKRRLLLEHGMQYGNTPCVKLYKRSFLQAHHILFPEGIRMEDIAFHQETLLKAERYYVSERILYNYRQNMNGIMLSPQVANYFMDTFYVQKDVYLRLKEEGYTDGLETVYAYIFYEKGFKTPMEYMVYGEDLIPYDEEKVHAMSETLHAFFPDILHNPYVLSDHTEENLKVLEILRGEAKKQAWNDALVDIMLIRGGQGGFENALCDSALYLTKYGCKVRLIQMAAGEAKWYPEETEYICLEQNPENLDFDTARTAYAKTLSETAVPDLILAAGWPYVVPVAKGAATDAGYAVPVCAWPHGDLSFYKESGSGRMEHLLYADLVFAINNTIAEDVYRAAPEKIIYRVDNAYDPSRPVYSEQRDTRKIAFVGRLSQEKAVSVILYALERTKSRWELYIAGNGDEETALKGLVKELGLTGRVHFLGWSSRPWEALKDCRALVMTSLYEGAPLGVLEALASGMQIISTPCGNVPEVVREGITGYLYPFADPESLAKILNRMEKTHFTAETARLCRDSVINYRPEKAMRDMLYKVMASVRRVVLPQRYEPWKNTDMMYYSREA